MILFLGKLILVPLLLTWTAWVPFLASHYPSTNVLLLSDFLAQHSNSSLLITSLLAPYVCLIYDTYRGTSRRIQFIMGALFVLLTLFSNLFIAFVLKEMLPDLQKDFQVILRIIDRIRAF